LRKVRYIIELRGFDSACKIIKHPVFMVGIIKFFQIKSLSS